MSGRLNATAPCRSVRCIGIPHAVLARTPQDRFAGKRQADRKRSRQRRRFPLSRSRRSAREGSRGRRKRPPLPPRHAIKISVTDVSPVSSSSVAQTVDEPKLCPVRALRRRPVKKIAPDAAMTNGIRGGDFLLRVIRGCRRTCSPRGTRTCRRRAPWSCRSGT